MPIQIIISIVIIACIAALIFIFHPKKDDNYKYTPSDSYDDAHELAVKALGYKDWNDYLTKHGYLKWGYEPSFEVMESAWYHGWGNQPDDDITEQ